MAAMIRTKQAQHFVAHTNTHCSFWSQFKRKFRHSVQCPAIKMHCSVGVMVLTWWCFGQIFSVESCSISSWAVKWSWPFFSGGKWVNATHKTQFRRHLIAFIGTVRNVVFVCRCVCAYDRSVLSSKTSVFPGNDWGADSALRQPWRN